MFTKEKSYQLKFIAFILMMVHHLFGFKERIIFGANPFSSKYIMGQEIVQSISYFSKICVPIFVFIAGYALWLDYENGKFNKLNYFTSKVINLFKLYWKVFLIFIPMGFIFFKNQGIYTQDIYFSNRFNNFSLSEFVNNLFGFCSSYNGEWWFFRFFIICLFYGILYINLFKKCQNKYLELFISIIMYFFFSNIVYNLPSMALFKNIDSSFWYVLLFQTNTSIVLINIGIIFAKYHLFDHWQKYLSNLKSFEKIILSLVIFAMTYYIVIFLYFDASYIIVVPLFIYAFLMLFDIFKFLEKPLVFVGKYTGLMWLIHSFYCYYYYDFAKFVYAGDNVILISLKLFALTFISAWLTEKFWQILFKIYGKIRNMKIKNFNYASRPVKTLKENIRRWEEKVSFNESKSLCRRLIRKK